MVGQGPQRPADGGGDGVVETEDAVDDAAEDADDDFDADADADADVVASESDVIVSVEQEEAEEEVDLVF